MLGGDINFMQKVTRAAQLKSEDVKKKVKKTC